ncbi:MAG: MarR family winged helix-turn-helix transcriptional regulator [Mycobacteriales bacterium]
MTDASEGATLASALVHLAHLVQRIFAEVSRSHDLTPQQAQLLCLLIDGPVGMGELSRTLNLEKSSLTGLVDRIERRGLAARNRDSCDRRACKIALTDEGLRLANKSHQDVIARVEALAAELSSADREMLISSTAKFGGLAART